MSKAKVEQLPSGNYRCRAWYKDETGKSRAKSFTAPTKKEAKLRAEHFLETLEYYKIPGNKTLGMLADEFIESCSNILSPSTIVGYQKIRRTAFQDIIDIRLSSLTKMMYQKAINNYAKDRSPKTVLSAHVFFHKLLKNEDINIADNVLLPKRTKTEVQIPETEEIQQFLYHISDTKIYLYVLFAICLGLRKSEIIAIRWKDIDFKHQIIRINKARVKDLNGTYVEKQTKTYSGTRNIYLPSVLEKELFIIKDELTDPNDTNYVITASPASLASQYNRLCKKFNFPYNFHALRHYHASILTANGIPNKYAMERMGHATENMLKNVYQHTFKSKQKEFDVMVDDSMTEIIGHIPEIEYNKPKFKIKSTRTIKKTV